VKLDIKKILEIPGESLEIDDKLDLSWVKRAGETIFPEQLAAKGKIKNQSGIVKLRYQLSGVMKFRCDRCLMQSEREINEEFVHTIVQELQDESLDDVYTICRDGMLNLAEEASNDLLVQLPQVLLCREDCKGLCPRCGTNLNTSTCNC